MIEKDVELLERTGKRNQKRESTQRAFKKPKYIQKIEAHYNECFYKEHCLLCNDCYAYTNRYGKKDDPRSFGKILTSTMSSKYNKCPRALDYYTILKLAMWLLRDKRHYISIHAHCEFNTGVPLND